MGNNKKIITGLVVVIALGAVGLFFVPQLLNNTNLNPAAVSTATQPSALPDITAGGTTIDGGTVYLDETVGTGTEAVAGKLVTVNYVGALTNGTVFDASAQHGGSFNFVLGQGTVIPGWDKGLVGMKVGGKRLLTVPANMAYGTQPVQGTDSTGKTVDIIPGNSTLLFEVELVDVKNAPAK